MNDYSPIILEEISNLNFVPTQEELQDYAKLIGFDLDKEPDLKRIAIDGITAPLPKFWRPILHSDNSVYFFNFETGESSWDHPLDQYHRGRVISERYNLLNSFQPPKTKKDFVSVQPASKVIKTEPQRESIFYECISEEDSSCSNGSCLAPKKSILKQTLREENLGNYNSEVESITKFISVKTNNFQNKFQPNTRRTRSKSGKTNESDIDITHAEEPKSDASIDLTLSMNAEKQKKSDSQVLPKLLLKYVCQIKELNEKIINLEQTIGNQRSEIKELKSKLESSESECSQKDRQIVCFRSSAAKIVENELKWGDNINLELAQRYIILRENNSLQELREKIDPPELETLKTSFSEWFKSDRKIWRQLELMKITFGLDFELEEKNKLLFEASRKLALDFPSSREIFHQDSRLVDELEYSNYVVRRRLKKPTRYSNSCVAINEGQLLPNTFSISREMMMFSGNLTENTHDDQDHPYII